MLGNRNSVGGRYNALQEMQGTPEAYFYVRRTVGAIQSIWEKQAHANQTKIETFFDADIPEILTIDSLKVQHCLNNLVENSVRTTKSGKIWIIATKIKMPNGKSYLALSVKDTGLGLSSTQIRTIFDRNANHCIKHRPVYGVVDTGLPMTHDLITELGGKVFVKSALGKGSVFALLLPLELSSTAEQNTAETETCTKMHSPYSDLNILVVDDYNLNQLTIKTLLHDHVGKIYSAIHGYEALEIMHSCPVDVILMDINMPVMDGCETTLKIRSSGQAWAGVHIFAMTADPQYHHTQLYRKIGMDGTLPKPFRKHDILNVLASCTMPYKRYASE